MWMCRTDMLPMIVQHQNISYAPNVRKSRKQTCSVNTEPTSSPLTRLLRDREHKPHQLRGLCWSTLNSKVPSTPPGHLRSSGGSLLQSTSRPPPRVRRAKHTGTRDFKGDQPRPALRRWGGVGVVLVALATAHVANRREQGQLGD